MKRPDSKITPGAQSWDQYFTEPENFVDPSIYSDKPHPYKKMMENMGTALLHEDTAKLKNTLLGKIAGSKTQNSVSIKRAIM